MPFNKANIQPLVGLKHLRINGPRWDGVAVHHPACVVARQTGAGSGHTVSILLGQIPLVQIGGLHQMEIAIENAEPGFCHTRLLFVADVTTHVELRR